MTFALCRATLPVLAKCQLEFQPQGLNLKPNWSRMKSITFRSPPAPPGSLPQKQCHHPLPPDSFNYSSWSRKHRDCNRGSRVDWLVWRNSCLMGRDQTPPRALSTGHDCGKVRRSMGTGGQVRGGTEHCQPRGKTNSGNTNHPGPDESSSAVG